MEINKHDDFLPVVPPKLDEDVSCPSCLAILNGEPEECTSCGVVISHFKRVSLEKRLKLTVAGLYHLSSFDCEALETAWQKVEAAYYDTEVHNQFIHLCYRFKSLPYAVKKYAQRVAVDPLDDIADMMKKRVLILAQESLPEAQTKELPPTMITRSLMRFFTAILSFSLIGGVFMLLISALTQHKLYFFGLGLFIVVSSLLSLLFMRRQFSHFT